MGRYGICRRIGEERTSRGVRTTGHILVYTGSADAIVEIFWKSHTPRTTDCICRREEAFIGRRFGKLTVLPKTGANSSDVVGVDIDKRS